ncbi:hypothetical protein B296_00029959 [Ensete ventricosum]|uniref:Uncharacterized protein n=1 Tax=Ensete ventricosum TaxID=4639 RepID=A0A426XY21_ENSVE|nr:hypothetical protein B296_00029959 [Ensete ventricosum]
MSSLLLRGTEGYPQVCSMGGRFCSLRFPTTRVSTTMYWFTLYSISSTVVRGCSTTENSKLLVQIIIKHDHQVYDLTSAIWQPLAFPTMSVTVFLKQSPGMFLAIFPIPSTKS